MAREEGFFDELARGLADGTLTRGKALRLMGSALVGGTLASLGIGEAGADPPGCKRLGKNCTRDTQCCGNLVCPSGTCQTPTTTTTETPTTTTTETPTTTTTETPTTTTSTSTTSTSTSTTSTSTTPAPCTAGTRPCCPSCQNGANSVCYNNANGMGTTCACGFGPSCTDDCSTCGGVLSACVSSPECQSGFGLPFRCVVPCT
jgi:hypothetical protein